MSGKFAILCLCDRRTAEEKAQRGLGENTEYAQHKGYTFLQGLLVFSNLTFRSDDDDFNVTDVIMSRVFCSADDGGLALREPCFRSIQYQRVTSHTDTQINENTKRYR